MGIFSFISNLFRPKTEFEKLRGMVGPMIVKGYRRLSKEHGRAPTHKTSDKKIVDIYIDIEARFKTAAKQRGEVLPQGYINNIVFYFYHVYESFDKNDVGQWMFEGQIDYEVKRYLKEGLRKSLKVDLQIFDLE